ncbi:hypothetical protein Vadar_012485 [Vaccinium darrowii]|uniref:Uncharacterized protein n=1 Tax=Vaccinium darrowii TaxID=229202 RepID=A0ACB7ZB87_9ERIC|nr:hypothetical protein Vadar_012485 [Vaccinium darrowii]
MDLSSFNTQLNVEDFLDWLQQVERFLDYMDIEKVKKVKLQKRILMSVAFSPLKGLESFVEDSMGLQSLFHEVHEVETVEKMSSHEKLIDVNLDDSGSTTKAVSGGSDYDDWDLVSDDELAIKPKLNLQLKEAGFYNEQVMQSLSQSPNTGNPQETNIPWDDQQARDKMWPLAGVQGRLEKA